MARVFPAERFELYYKVHFNTVIRGYHVYKNVWDACGADKLYCKHDTRGLEAPSRCGWSNKFNNSMLVGHLPMELSSLIEFFLKDTSDNFVVCSVTGKRYRELGLAKAKENSHGVGNELYQLKLKLKNLTLELTATHRMYPSQEINAHFT